MRSLWNDCDDHMYVFESSCGHIKIGRARDVEARLRAIQSTCPPSVTVSILAVAENHGDWKYGMHEVFAEFRVRGEWFSAAAGEKLRALLAKASLPIIARQLARKTGKQKGQRLTGPDDRRGEHWVRLRRRKALGFK